jgi:hypothetical protein
MKIANAAAEDVYFSRFWTDFGFYDTVTLTEIVKKSVRSILEPGTSWVKFY